LNNCHTLNTNKITYYSNEILTVYKSVYTPKLKKGAHYCL